MIIRAIVLKLYRGVFDKKSLEQLNKELIANDFQRIGHVPGNGSSLIIGQTGAGQQYMFTFYSDEIAVFQSEILGKTAEEVFELLRKKDVEYLRS